MRSILVNTEIKLRPIGPDDAEEIYNTIDSQREYLGEWLPFVEYTREKKDTLIFIESVINPQHRRPEPAFTIRYKENFAGIIALKESDPANKKTEIGYWLSKDFQHKGIMTMAVKTLVGYVFKRLKYNRITIKCAVKNAPSIKIPKSLNFKYEGIEREGELLSSKVFTDLEVYSCLASEWKAE